MAEKVMWEGTPSQWSNFMFYMLCIPLIIVFGLGLILALWKYFDTQYNKIQITDQRVIEQRGVLAKITDELDLYQIKYIKYERPFALQFFGLSNIILGTTDPVTPRLVLRGMKDKDNLKDRLRMAIDTQRDLKGEWLKELYFN